MFNAQESMLHICNVGRYRVKRFKELFEYLITYDWERVKELYSPASFN